MKPRMMMAERTTMKTAAALRNVGTDAAIA